MCNILLEKTNRDRIVQQEKGDYELAKMLQEYDVADQPIMQAIDKSSSKLNGLIMKTLQQTSAADHVDLLMPSTRRYFLRSRSKAATPPQPAADTELLLVNGTVNKSKVIQQQPQQNGKIHKRATTAAKTRAVGKRKSSRK